MFQRMRLLALTIVLLAGWASQASAQQICVECRQNQAANQRAYARRQAELHRKAVYQREWVRRASVRQVQAAQHTSPVHASDMPPLPDRYQVAQNPLDALQRELEGEGVPSTDDFLRELEEVDLNHDLDSPPNADLQGERGGGDYIDAKLKRNASRRTEPVQRRGRTTDRKDSTSSRRDKDEDDEDDEDEDDEDDSRLSAGERARRRRVDSTPGLRSNDYYRSLGAPKQVASRNRDAMPLTMEHILGEEDEYDCQCQRRYCDSVWQCAGGRGASSLARIRRNLDRDYIVRNAGRNGCRPYRNDFKCPKVKQQEDEYAAGGGYRAPRLDASELQPTPAEEFYYYGDTQYLEEFPDTSVLGDEYYDAEPVPIEGVLPEME